MGWAIALHGGAGDIPFSLPPDRRELRLAALRRCLQQGVSALQDNKSALDVVELVVRELENDPQYNAGAGSVLTSDGTVEMEACIMDGNTMRCGAVSGLTTVINPISLARRIMDTTPHIYLAFHAAQSFAQSQALPIAHPKHFITQDNIQRLHQAKASDTIKIDHDETGTVGCVAVDIHGNLATATSTGGLVNKMAGRIGDTPIIGAGTYANHLCAVSATGKGEEIIRSTAARDVAALMEFKGLSLTAATAEVINHRTPRGTCGIIAVSPNGDITLQFNTTGMYRAAATQAGHHEVAIWP